MTLKRPKVLHLVILTALFSISLIACGGGGGGGGGGGSRSADLSVQPANFDFGKVTEGNVAFVKPLDVTLQNNGTANLVVSSIVLNELTGTDVFILDPAAGSDACGSAAPTIVPNDSCTVRVTFLPGPDDLETTPTANLAIASNDPASPTVTVGLSGTYETVKSIDVQISQVLACPRPDARAFVSVRDQNGFTVTDLAAANFVIEEDGAALPPLADADVEFVGNNVEPLSVTLVMDYSGSVLEDELARADMENAAVAFVQQFGTGDEAEIIKFGTESQVMQAFTTNQTLLEDAIRAFPDTEGFGTRLYDTINLAVLRTEPSGTNFSNNDRKAIIVITDGTDDDGTGQPLSTLTRDQVIANAQLYGVPIFTIGVSDADTANLQAIAAGSGGAYIESATSDNLATAYQQLANLLLSDQYRLTYDSILPAGGGNLTVTVTSGTLTDDATRLVPECVPF